MRKIKLQTLRFLCGLKLLYLFIPAEIPEEASAEYYRDNTANTVIEDVIEERAEPIVEESLEERVDQVLQWEMNTFKLVAQKDIRKRTEKYAHIVKKAAKTYPSVPEHLINAVMYVESGGNPYSVSPKGARGLMQLMPETEMDMGVPSEKWADPYHSIMGGTRYLSKLMRRYNREEVLALIAYNRGPTAVDRYLERRNLKPEDVRWEDIQSLLRPETRDYVARVRASKYAIGGTS